MARSHFSKNKTKKEVIENIKKKRWHQDYERTQ